MTQMELVGELKNFPVSERITIVEDVLEIIREDIQKIQHPPTRTIKKSQLAAAAQFLLQDYETGGRLTDFTTLDSDDFYV